MPLPEGMVDDEALPEVDLVMIEMLGLDQDPDVLEILGLDQLDNENTIDEVEAKIDRQEPILKANEASFPRQKLTKRVKCADMIKFDSYTNEGPQILRVTWADEEDVDNCDKDFDQMYDLDWRQVTASLPGNTVSHKVTHGRQFPSDKEGDGMASIKQGLHRANHSNLSKSRTHQGC